MTFQKAVSFLSPYIPAALAIKGLGKVSPELQSFVTSAAAGGYSSDAILGFLREKLEAPGYSKEQDRLSQGNNLRPDEAASQQRVNQRERVPSAIGTGLNAAASVAAPFVSSAASTALSGNSQAQPESKQKPEGQNQGYDALAGLKEFPELIRFVQEEQARGGNAQSIASKAKKSSRLSTFVNVIEQKSEEPFESLLSRLLGSNQQNASSQTQVSSKQKDIIDRLKNRLAKM